MMNTAAATGEFGLVVRRKALMERNISLDDLLSAMQANAPLDSNEDLITFGPSFGQEALDVFTKRLISLGFEYFDDFFELVVVLPNWCKVQLVLAR